MKYKVNDRTFNTYEEALEYTRTFQGGTGSAMIETISDDAMPQTQGNSDDDIGSFLDTLYGQAQNGSEKDRAAGRAFSENEVQEARMNWMMQQNQRQYEQDIYDQRYSFQGQINQMQQAGVNPGLLYGGVGTTASQGGAVSQSAEAPSHDTTASPTDRLNSFISLFGTLFGLGTDIAEKINTIKTGKSQRDLSAIQGGLVSAQTATEESRKANVEADTAEKNEMRQYYNNKRVLENLMGVLDRQLRRGQISEQNYKVSQAALDYAFSSESYQVRLDRLVLENEQLSASTQFIYAQTAQAWSQKSLNEAQEDLAKANTDLTNYLVTQEGLNTEVRQYAQDNNLPYDQPVVVMTHQRLSTALAEAMYDQQVAQTADEKSKARKAVAALTKAIADIEVNNTKLAQGRMTKSEKTRFWAEQMQKILGEAMKAASIYMAGRSIGKTGSKSGDVETTYEYDSKTGRMVRKTESETTFSRGYNLH